MPWSFQSPQLITPERICLSWHGLQDQTHHVQWVRSAYLSVSPLCFITLNLRCRNFDLLSIAFATRYGLGPTYPTLISIA